MVNFSKAVAGLRKSPIRAVSERCAALNGINLGQGICDLPVLDAVKQQACKAIRDDHNTYAPHMGIMPLREAIAEKARHYNGISANPREEVLVTHGSTGGYAAAVKTLLEPGDEVILFEPFYGYHKNILNFFGIQHITVPVSLEDYQLDLEQLAQQIGPRTRAIVVCTPNNPSGKVYTREELDAIGALAVRHDLIVITDEIYEYITYPGHSHYSLGSHPEYGRHVVTLSGFSKTYNMTGWRLGYAIGPAAIIEKMGLVHDMMYVCPPTPLQHGVIRALEAGDAYYAHMRETYLNKRNFMAQALREMGFGVPLPQGAYYMMVDIRDVPGLDNDFQAVDYLLEHAYVGTTAGSAFYDNDPEGSQRLRLCYALTDDKLEAAVEQLYQTLCG